MLSNSRSLATAFILAATVTAAAAQTDPAPPPPLLPPPSAAPVASAPRSFKPAPRLLTPAERRDSTATTGDLRPQGQVTKQISIPLGKKPPPAPKATEASRNTSSAPGGIDDAQARCEAEAEETQRSACRARLARGAKP